MIQPRCSKVILLYFFLSNDMLTLGACGDTFIEDIGGTMIVRMTDMKSEYRENMRNGTGGIDILHLIEPSSVKNVRLLAEMKVPPGSSIGKHLHELETEFFIIIEGTGIADDDGTESEIYAGDVLVTGGGHYHSIRNDGTEDLRMIAIIVTQ